MTIHQEDPDRSNLDRAGNKLDAIIAYGVCAFILVVLVFFALEFNPQKPSPWLLTLLSGTTGSALGWATGIVASPYDPKEEKKFRSVAKAAYAFVTGYALAKLDPLVTSSIDTAKTAGVSLQVSTNLLVGLVAFIAVATATYVSRKYWP